MGISRLFSVNAKGELADTFGEAVKIAAVTTSSGSTYYLKGARLRPAGEPLYAVSVLIPQDDCATPALQAWAGDNGEYITTSPIRSIQTDRGETFVAEGTVKTGPASWNVGLLCRAK